MKIFNKAFAALMFLPLMAGLTACHDEHAEYNPATDGNSTVYDVAHLVYFSSETTSATELELSEEENSFFIYLERDSVGGEVEVKLESTQKAGDATSLLNIPESVVFPDSVDRVAVEITYDPATILAAGGMIDTVSIVLPDGAKYQAGYMGGRYDFVASLLPFTPWCRSAAEFEAAGGTGEWPFRESNLGTYTYKAWQTGNYPGASVAFRQNIVTPNQVQFLIDNWGAGMFTGAGVQVRMSGTWDDHLKVYALSWPETYTGYSSSTYGPVYVSDYISYSGSTWDEYPVMYDPENGLFTVNVIYYVGAGYYGYGPEYIQMDGFKPYEANLASDFEWKAELDGEFNSAKLGTKSACVLYKGVCVNNTDNCDSTFAATYGTAYKLEAPYTEKNDLYFCVSPEGKIILAPGVDALQPTGLTALDQDVFAKINPKGSSFVGKKLILNISFVNKDESMDYGTTNEIFSAASWISLGMATYTDGIVAGLFDVAAPTYEVEIFENEATPGIYRMKYPYGEIYPYNEEGDWDDSKSYDITINAEDPTSVYIEEQPLGIDYGYGMMYVISNAARYLASGYSIEVIKANDIEFGTLEGGVITFPVKGLLVFMDDGGYYANTNGEFKLVLPETNGVKAQAKANFTGKQAINHKLAAKSSVKKASTRKVNWKGRYVGNRLENVTLKHLF